MEVVARSAKILGTVINDILDFSKIEAGKLELEKVVILLPELVNQVIETFTFQARDKGLKLELIMDEALPEFVVGDPGRLRQILINLIGNALKFTEEGSVTLEVKSASLEGHRYSIQFAVRDTGVGISEENQKDIFEPFTQADNTITRKFGGTGLGLNIAQKLVAKMGGELEVESQEGQGSAFIFTAHFSKASDQQIEQMQEREFDVNDPETLDRLSPATLKILLVEDNKLNQRVALGMLAKLGCSADTAEDGSEAMEYLRAKKFDLVFMDLQMPKMGGMEAMRRLRAGEAGEENRNVPVIAMTAHASREDRKGCLAVGMNDYIPKPISTELIGQAMKRVLDSSVETVGRDRDKNFTMKQLIAQTDGDVEIAAEVLDLFMADARKRLNLIIGGLQNYDLGFATREARSLESAALSIHSAVIVDLARQLIQAAEGKQQEFALRLAEDIRAELNHMVTVI